MDFFGIGQAIKGALQVYFMNSRRTGRTVSMIESLKNGDRIIFNNSQEAHRVRRLCEEQGKKVECVFFPIDRVNEIFTLRTGQGKTIFDHSWIEEYYLSVIDAGYRNIDDFQKQLSGYSEAHRETRRRAIELSKLDI
jgi:hypothetical protein